MKLPPRVGLTTCTARADREEEGCPKEKEIDQEEGCPKEKEIDQEEGCPEEEMRRFLPYENGGTFERAGV
jgi:hypothetical protein